MRKAFIIFATSITILTACDRKGVFDDNLIIPNEEWELNHIATFNFLATDTVSTHHIFVNTRNTTDFSNSNLYLFITTHAPNGATLRDTLECILANSKGDWLGKGFGRIRDNQIPYKKNIRFPVEGNYIFEIQHGMRATTLKDIVSVGIRVERAN